MSKKKKQKKYLPEVEKGPVSQLIFPSFDAQLYSAGYTPEYKGKSRCVFLLNELWDEEK